MGPVKVDSQPDLTREQQEIARVLADPGQWVHRLCWDDYAGTTYEELHVWQARALIAFSDALQRRPRSALAGRHEERERPEPDIQTWDGWRRPFNIMDHMTDVDDAIHCLREDGTLFCGLPSAERHALELVVFPRHDAGGSYCWTCLRETAKLRDGHG